MSDIIRYIQNRLESTQNSEEGLDLHTAMRANNTGQSQGNFSTGHLGGPRFALRKQRRGHAERASRHCSTGPLGFGQFLLASVLMAPRWLLQVGVVITMRCKVF